MRFFWKKEILNALRIEIAKTGSIVRPVVIKTPEIVRDREWFEFINGYCTPKVSFTHFSSISSMKFSSTPSLTLEAIDDEIPCINSNAGESLPLGAYAIEESMAELIESFHPGYSTGPLYPYHSVKYFFDGLINDTVTLSRLCLIALNARNPGRTIGAIREIVKNENVDLSTVSKIACFVYKRQKEIGIFPDFMMESHIMAMSAADYIFGKTALQSASWLKTVSCTNKMDRIYKLISFLRMFDHKMLNVPSRFTNFYARVGIPPITNDNQEFGFYHSSKLFDQSSGAFYILSSIINVLEGNSPVECEYVDCCRSSPAMAQFFDSDCGFSPWNKSNFDPTCYYGILWNTLGLSGKSVK